MALTPGNGLLLVRLRRDGVADYFTGVHYASPDAPSPAALDVIGTAVEAQPDNWLSASYVMEELISQHAQAPGIIETRSTTFSQSGSGGAQALPPNCALIVRKQTGLQGRANRGRHFVPGVPEADATSGGAVSSFVRDNALIWWEALYAAMEAGGFDPRIFHDSTGGSTAITQLVVAGVIGTQRPRMDN